MARTGRLWAAAVGALVSTVIAPGASAHVPVRAGTIVGGVFDTGPGPGCEFTAECLAWLESDCHPAVARRRAGLHAAIVDVAAFAGARRERTLSVRAVGGTPVSVRWGGLQIQFWSPDCHEVIPVAPVGDGDYGSRVRYSGSFRVPRGVAWMTLVSDDSSPLRWEFR